MGHYDIDESKVKAKDNNKKLNIKKQLKNIKNTTNNVHITKADINCIASIIRGIIQDDGINPTNQKELNKFEENVINILEEIIYKKIKRYIIKEKDKSPKK